MRWSVLAVSLCTLKAAVAVYSPAEAIPSSGTSFEAWSLKHGKRYPSAQARAVALHNFLATDARIRKHNSELSRMYDMGHNAFSDFSESDWLSRSCLVHNDTASQGVPVVRLGSDVVSPPPEAWDWREHGAVTGVKDQGGCGSCGAFSATGVLEGATHISSGLSVIASEQEILDCSEAGSCKGGTPLKALLWAVHNGGVASEHAYEKYTGSDWYACDRNISGRSKSAYAHAAGKVDLGLDRSQYNLTLMQALLRQPLSIALYAGPEFMSYAGGIFSVTYNTTCYTNHAALLVGYGTDEGTPYWTVKNSWGTSWGEGGYVRLLRGSYATGNTACLFDYEIAFASPGPATTAPPPPPPDTHISCSTDSARDAACDSKNGYCCCTDAQWSPMIPTQCEEGVWLCCKYNEYCRRPGKSLDACYAR